MPQALSASWGLLHWGRINTTAHTSFRRRLIARPVARYHQTLRRQKLRGKMGRGNHMKLLSPSSGFAFVFIASLVGLTNSEAFAQQTIKIGYAPFATPLSWLPDATPENYRTLDANTAQGAMIDLYKAIAKDVGFQIQFVFACVRRTAGGAAVLAKLICVWWTHPRKTRPRRH
jgi:hypothetical protein